MVVIIKLIFQGIYRTCLILITYHVLCINMPFTIYFISRSSPGWKSPVTHLLIFCSSKYCQLPRMNYRSECPCSHLSQELEGTVKDEKCENKFQINHSSVIQLKKKYPFLCSTNFRFLPSKLVVWLQPHPAPSTSVSTCVILSKDLSFSNGLAVSGFRRIGI